MRLHQNITCVLLVVCLLSVIRGHKVYRPKLVEENGGKGDCRDSVGFLVLNSKPLINLAAGTNVIYDKIVTNVGNGYDKTSGVFTAPASGLYSFSWTTLAQNGKQFCTWLLLNGNPIAKNHPVANHSSDYISASQTVVLQMKKMDHVVIQVVAGHKGQFMQSNGWSTFSGIKV